MKTRPHPYVSDPASTAVCVTIPRLAAATRIRAFGPSRPFHLHALGFFVGSRGSWLGDCGLGLFVSQCSPSSLRCAFSPRRSSATTRSILLTTSSNAASRSVQAVTGAPSHGLHLGEGRALPATGAENQWDDGRLAALVPFQRLLHLSKHQQYSEAMKLALTNKRMISAEHRL